MIAPTIPPHLPWAASLQFSIHWLRHTTLTWVEREYSYAVARAYAGHSTAPNTATGATLTYVRAGLPEVAHALDADRRAPSEGGHRSTPAVRRAETTGHGRRTVGYAPMNAHSSRIRCDLRVRTCTSSRTPRDRRRPGGVSHHERRSRRPFSDMPAENLPPPGTDLAGSRSGRNPPGWIPLPLCRIGSAPFVAGRTGHYVGGRHNPTRRNEPQESK